MTKLADLITKASADGARLEVKIPGAAWGDTLILESGRTDPKEKTGAHGVKHALEELHHVSALEIAETLVNGRMEQSDSSPSRSYLFKGNVKVVLEREIHIASGRVSKHAVKLHTALKQE